ncbi:MAG: hypothetical protein EXS59_00215 [Candidatus Taylorbacteria bacterium]|nr:hypothetical protein [Candidatus Taylorbacteria bacterium]
MTRTQLIKQAFVILFIIVLLHISASVFFLYSYYWWFDIPLHFLAGCFAGSFTLWFFGKKLQKSTILFSLSYVLMGTFIVGTSWELFEYFASITQNSIGSYPLDTLKDMAVDLLGGVSSFVYFSLNRHR